jgi:hypothetical protein
MGREARDGARSEIVAVGEAAGQDHGVGAAEARVLVPHELGILPEHRRRNVVGVSIAVGTREDDHGELHDCPPGVGGSTSIR